MQEASLFSEFVKEDPNQLKDVVRLLTEHEKLFRWFSDEVVLDIGCGPGAVTRHALYPYLPEEAKKTVLGIDSSPIMKNVGEKKFSYPDVFFETLDISSKDLGIILRDDKFQNGFSKIFSFNTIHWISDLEATFKNIHRLLKPQGQALLAFPCSRQYQKLYQQMQKKEPWSTILKGAHREIPHYFLSDDPVGELISLVHGAGLKPLSCSCITAPDEFPNLDVFKKLVGSLDVHFKKIPVHLQARYLEECIEELKDRLTETEDGKISVKETRMTIFLEKL